MLQDMKFIKLYKSSSSKEGIIFLYKVYDSDFTKDIELFWDNFISDKFTFMNGLIIRSVIAVISSYPNDDLLIENIFICQKLLSEKLSLPFEDICDIQINYFGYIKDVNNENLIKRALRLYLNTRAFT